MDIVFLGTHGQYNVGDELLLETFLRQLGPAHRYAVNSYDPAFTQADLRAQGFQAEAFHTTRDLPRFLWRVLRARLLFFGGGSIIKELYASIGRHPYATLWMILAVVTFAKQIARKRVVMSNIGVGPLTTPGGRRLARWVLRQVDFVSVRDARSLALCQELGLANVRQVPDAVFANPPEALLPAPPLARAAGPALHVALNLNYDIANPAAWPGFLNSLADCLRQWQAQQPLVIHALPMQARFKANDDLSVLTAFRERLPEIEMIVHTPANAQAVAEIIAGCDLVLAERLHTLVISAILGRPFFGLVYDVKVAELVAALGMAPYAFDINQPLTAEALLKGVTCLAHNRTVVSAQLRQRSAELRAELTHYFAAVRAELG